MVLADAATAGSPRASLESEIARPTASRRSRDLPANEARKGAWAKAPGRKIPAASPQGRNGVNRSSLPLRASKAPMTPKKTTAMRARKRGGTEVTGQGAAAPGGGSKTGGARGGE